MSELLVPRPVEAVNVSPAYLFRKVAADDGAPTLLFDEIDTVFGPKAKDNEEIRGLLNAGHRKGAVAGRCVVRGKEVFTEELPGYCAVAMAGLGYPPDTIFTRSVIIKMRRRAPNETVEPYRRRLEVEKGERLRDRLALWATTILDQVRDTYPIMPEGIADRAADVWEALLSVADAAGGEWPERARVTAVTLVTSSIRGEGSLGIQLLTDIKTVFGEREAMATKALLNELINMDEFVWADIKGKPITDRGLAFRCAPMRWGQRSSVSERARSKGTPRKTSTTHGNGLPRPPMEEVTKVTSVTGNGHDQISHDERVDLMMKHTGLTQEQAEAEAAAWN